MFDFEKLETYHKAKEYNSLVYAFLVDVNIDHSAKNQLKRASLSIMLNIAEGSGRFTKPDRKNFYVLARGSVFECVALFDFLKDQKLLSEPAYQDFYSKSEELSKMIFGMIKSLS